MGARVKFTRIVAALLAGIALVLVRPIVANAEEPLELSSNFEDHADSVSNDSAVLNAVREVPGTSLWVVIVSDFGSTDADVWAKETAKLSHLRSYDGLVAISTETREIGYSPGYKTPGANNANIVDESVITTAVNNSDVKELLADEQWEEGVTLIASNISTLVRGGSIASKTPLFVLLGLAGVAVVVLVIVVKRTKKKKAAADAASLQELATTASSQLIQVDDAVRSALAELEFARAEFGLEATRKFAEVLEKAMADIRHAFTLRTTLSDEHPETPTQQRQMYGEILQIAQTTRAQLAEHEKSFTELRNLSARIEQKIGELDQRAGEVKSQLPLAQAQLNNMALSYPPHMLQSLSILPQQVDELLTSVQTSLKSARSEVAQGNKNSAVPYTQLAEGTLNNAVALLKKIDQGPQLIKEAQAELAARVKSLSSDVHDAQRLGAGNAAIAAAQAVAEKVLTAAANTADADIIALNDQLEDAEADLDAALVQVRAQEEAHRRLQNTVSQAKRKAKSAIEEAEEHITRYRSGIGAEARHQLALAHEKYAEALNLPLEQQEIAFRSAREYARAAKRYGADLPIFGMNMNSSGNNNMGSFLAGMVVSSVLNGLSSNRGRHIIDGDIFSGFNPSHGGGFGGFDGFDGGRSGGRIGF